MRSVVQHGANLKVVINNKTLGLVTGFTYSIDYGRKSLRGVDNPFPQEIVSGQQTVRGTVSCVRLQGVSLENIGVVTSQFDSLTHLQKTTESEYQKQDPKTKQWVGTGEKVNVTVNLNTGTIGKMAADPYISIALVDRGDDTAVFRVDMASVTSQQWSVGARGMMTGSFEFEAVVQTR
jgi:hypothetical protein